MLLPEQYDGKPNMDAFDSWSFDVVNYMEFLDIDDQSMIKLLATLVTKDVKSFYMKYVA